MILKYMMLTIWSSKGGVGKTSIAVEMAKRLNAAIITNEANTRVPLFSFLKGKYFVLEHEQTISELPINEKGNTILDFGGMVDPRVLEAVELSKFILMPVTPSMIDIQKCAEDIEGILATFRDAMKGSPKKEIEETLAYILSKFVIISNKALMETETEAVVQQISNILSQSGIKHEFNHFTIPLTKSLQHMHAEMRSISEMIEAAGNPLLKNSYKKVNQVFADITGFVTNN